MQWKLYYLCYCWVIICSVLRNIKSENNYDKILNKNYKSDVEFIFDPDFDLNKQTNDDESIQKYFHKYRETELNLMSGVRMICHTPSKIKKIFKTEIDRENLNLSEEWATIFFRDISKLCYNSHYDGWYYKLCPMRSATQVLGYKKKDEKTGEEYSETWLLGVKDKTKEVDFNPIEFYQKEKSDYNSFNLKDEPFVMVEEGNRIAKIFNYDLSTLNQYELMLIINYDVEEVRNKIFEVSKDFKTLNDYLASNPEAKKIPISRKMLKLVNNHLVILDRGFPSNKITEDMQIILIKKRTGNDIGPANTLKIYGDLIYCTGCEFLTDYKPSDSILIRIWNGVNKSIKDRIIVHIFDNHLLKVDRPYPKNFQKFILKNDYFDYNSRNGTRLIEGDGYISHTNTRILVGVKTKFKSQIIPGDKLFLYNQKNVILDNISRRSQETECVVEKVFNNNLILTKNPCVKPFGNNKSFVIIKQFYKYPLSYYTFTSPVKLFGLIDFHTVDNLKFDKGNFDRNLTLKSPGNSQYIFHPGFIIRSVNNTVFKLKLDKIKSGKSKLRILFGTNLENYNRRESNGNDYELLINSESGCLIKQIQPSQSGLADIEFIDTDIRSFFQESINIDIIFYNNSIYLNSEDDDKDTSVKLKYITSVPIKYLYFDKENSENILINEIKKINMIEQKFLFNIFVYEKRLTLGTDISYIENFNNGEFCPQVNDHRKIHVKYKCDRTGVHDLIIEKINEDTMCEYTYIVSTRHLCNPHDLMSSKIEKSIVKSKCVVDGNSSRRHGSLMRNYNYNDDIYFKNLN